MAYTYKSIGNTTASVVSLLAIGTLCWWQRTPGPINAPRPQDEAEIMTAVLERHYAMGQMSVLYGTLKDAYISTVADSNALGGVRCVTNSEAYTLTNTVGFFPNAVNLYPYAIRLAFVSQGGWDLLHTESTPPDDLQPPVYTPRFELDDLYGEVVRPYKGPHIGWIVPDDAYMVSGDTSWFGSHASSNIFPSPAMYYAGDSANRDDVRPWFDEYFQRQKFVWTNYVTLPTAKYKTTTNYQYQASVNTNVTPWRTNILTTTTNYAGEYQANTYYELHQGFFTEWGWYALPSMMFPFERDSQTVRMNDPLWVDYYDGFLNGGRDEPANKMWSTNAYRDMGRALSLMQWARDIRDTESQVVVTVTWTNALNGNVPWTGGVYEGTTVSTNVEDFGIYDKYLIRWEDGSGGYIVQSGWEPFNGYTGGKARLTIVTTLRQFRYANNSPFFIDTVHIWPTGTSTNGAIPAAWTDRIDLCATLPPNTEIVRTNLWPCGVAEIESWSRSIGDGWQTNDIASLQQYSISFDRGVYPETGLFVDYHVQFTALTNYLDHAPAR
jgi:hypothetical protein